MLIKLISVERMDSAFFCALLTDCSLFKLQLPFKCINFPERETTCHRLLSWSSYGFKARLFLLIKVGDCSAINRVVILLVTIVTPHVGTLMIFRCFVYTAGNRCPDFLLCTCSEEGLGPLVHLIFSKFSKRLK
jgi:hypothetical protein